MGLRESKGSLEMSPTKPQGERVGGALGMEGQNPKQPPKARFGSNRVFWLKYFCKFCSLLHHLWVFIVF
jgi:hypothetical protein